MKKSRFTDSQIIDALKRAEAGLTVPELCRELGISAATFSKWRAKFGGMEVSEARRLRELEAENAKLKHLLAEAHLDLHARKSVLGVKRYLRQQLPLLWISPSPGIPAQGVHGHLREGGSSANEAGGVDRGQAQTPQI